MEEDKANGQRGRTQDKEDMRWVSHFWQVNDGNKEMYEKKRKQTGEYLWKIAITMIMRQGHVIHACKPQSSRGVVVISSR